MISDPFGSGPILAILDWIRPYPILAISDQIKSDLILMLSDLIISDERPMISDLIRSDPILIMISFAIESNLTSAASGLIQSDLISKYHARQHMLRTRTIRGSYRCKYNTMSMNH